MIIKKIYTGVLLLALISTLSCNKSEDTSSNSNDKNIEKKSEVKASSKDGEISAILDISKKPIPKLVPLDLKLTLKQGNEGIRNADISLDLTMPGMEMPKNVVKLKESLSGIYNGQAIFTMSGDWRIFATAKFNGKSQDMYFDIKVQ